MISFGRLSLFCLAGLMGCAASQGDAPSAPASAPSAAETPMMSKTPLLPALGEYLEDVMPHVETIPAERREPLDRLAEYIAKQRSSGQPIDLVFICTHNSRRSQMGQVWAAVAAAYYGIEGVRTFSGGTEATAFNPRAVEALRRAGFEIESAEGDGDNPHYRVSFSPVAEPAECYSKVFSDQHNPQDSFVALMTCTDADAACPFVPGAALRLAVPYDDPKVADGTPEEAARYDERSRQIATEMLYLFSRVAG